MISFAILCNKHLKDYIFHLPYRLVQFFSLKNLLVLMYNKCPFKSFYYLYLLFTVHNLHMLFYEKEAVQKLRQLIINWQQGLNENLTFVQCEDVNEKYDVGYLTVDFFCYQDDLALPVKVLRGHLGRKMKNVE